MNNYVALFRGINVGGKHILPMQELRDILAAVGCENVQTYNQSGNAVFTASATATSISNKISTAIDNGFGFAPQVLLLTADRFKAIAESNPFPEGESTPKSLHVSFLTEAPADPDLDALKELQADSEQFVLQNDAFFLLAPDGIGRSKLAAKVDRYLGVATTGRNWRTVSKLLDMISESDS
jgi:uncharacterized protein (DUF1697 family)